MYQKGHSIFEKRRSKKENNQVSGNKNETSNQHTKFW